MCPVGLYSFPIPLRAGRESLAYLIVGPVIIGKYREMEQYIKIAEELGIDPENFLDALREIKIFSFSGIKSVIELLYDIGLYVCELGYQNIKLQDLVPRAPNILARVHKFYVEKLLSALLEVSYSYTEAERGSVMLLDEEKGELYIKIAKGLSEEIVGQAKLKIGEGLAGIVAQNKKPLFINENIEDKEIRKRLNKPQLKYSMLIPIKVKNKLLGVLNISTSKVGADKFTSQSAQTIDKLIQLVETTLLDIPHANIQ
jgi:hypothetical protein